MVTDPVAWAFYNEDGSIRFIVEGRDRAELWKSTHEGLVVALSPTVETSSDLVSMLRAAHENPFATEYDHRQLLLMAANAIDQLKAAIIFKTKQEAT